MDTQADGSVTNIRELLGDLDPGTSFRIKDWSGITTGKQYLAGVLGPNGVFGGLRWYLAGVL